MSFNYFLLKLGEAKQYENEAAKRLCNLYNKTLVKICNNYKYDFKTDDGRKYEVKADCLALRTNNYFIEFQGYGKPTGISTTAAHFYIITNTQNYYLISTTKLKKLIRGQRYKYIRTTKDKFNGRLTHGYIFDCNIIHNHSKFL